MKKRYICGISILIIGIFFFVISMDLFYNQLVAKSGAYLSDLPAHVEFAKSGNGYSLIDLLLGLIVNISDAVSFINTELMISGFGALMVIATVISIYVFFVRKLKMDVIYSVFSSTFLMILTSLYIPYISPYFDLTGFIRQPWHSYTYIGMRLGAVWVMYFFIDRLENPRREGKWRDLINISVSLLLTTWVKPNFLVSFSLVLLLWLIGIWIKGKCRKEVTLDCVYLGITVLPSVIIAFLQSKILFDQSSQESSGIAFALLNSAFFKNGGRAVLLQLFTCLIFPTVVAVLAYKLLSKRYFFCLSMFIISFLEIVFFMETGKRAADNNFYWGVYVSSFFLFAVSLDVFFKAMKELKKPTKIILIVIGLFLIIWHIGSGVLYMHVIWKGDQNVWPWIVEPYFPWLHIV